MISAGLDALIEAEIAKPPPPALRALAEQIAERHRGVMAILFYGSCRRTGDLSGLADLYVLYRGHRAFHGKPLPALMNALLPPNVSLASLPYGGATVRAKVAGNVGAAVQRPHAQPRHWIPRSGARFAQPASLIYARDEAARRWVVASLRDGISTAVFWSRRLAPGAGTPAAHWQALFARTYRTELRARARHPAVAALQRRCKLV